MKFDELIQFAVKNDASDIHLQANSPPMLRIGGKIRFVESSSLASEDLLQFIVSLVPGSEPAAVASRVDKGLDFSYAIPNLCRFRCSAYRQMGQAGMVMRIIRDKIPSFESLNLPKVIADIALSQRGLTLVTGTTGSGKSTTLAAMIDMINTSYRTKILTIEDPIEYVHIHKNAFITQIEVGIDTPSFGQALRQALRQDPDVILVGELRDVESLRIALHAADTGHQVFSTVHSANAPQTIERIIAMFPPAEHKILLSQLAGAIEAIISQRLMVTTDGKRRPAMEILRGGGVTEKCILEGDLGELRKYIETGEAGMQSFDQHILGLYQEGCISGKEALRWASNPDALARGMRGIKGVGGLK
jgi:twitching motility protein PilT